MTNIEWWSEFEEMLQSELALTKYKRNVTEAGYQIDGLKRVVNPQQWVDVFRWRASEEGEEFWDDIHQKWQRKVWETTRKEMVEDDD